MRKKVSLWMMPWHDLGAIEGHTMKSLLAAIVAAATLAAAVSPASAWYCSARGTTGASGWGRSGNLGSARIIALRECAVRTPRGATCYIMYCT